MLPHDSGTLSVYNNDPIGAIEVEDFKHTFFRHVLNRTILYKIQHILTRPLGNVCIQYSILISCGFDLVCIIVNSPYQIPHFTCATPILGENRNLYIFTFIDEQVYTWVGQDRCTINEVCHRLHQAGVRTRTGKEYWDHKTIWDMLKNPAYKGEAAFGKTRWVPNGPRLRVPHGKPTQPRRPFWGEDAPKEDWISIPVPALIDPALFDAVQEQLEENRRRARLPEKGSRYLLQGLLVCAKCGYAYHGLTNDERNAYYRCSGSMSLPRWKER